MEEANKSSKNDIIPPPPLDAINQLTNALVRIFDDKGQVVGTGFLVDDKDILTSARVLAQALGRSEDFPTTERVQTGPAIHVDFPLIQPRKMYNAQNNRLIPRRPGGGGDFATLSLLHDFPPNLKPISLLDEENLSVNLWGHRFWALVTSEGKDSGDWIFGTFLEKQENDWIKIKINHIDSFGPRFDGTPIWDEQLNRFVGMGVELGSPSNEWVGYIIPSNYLISQFGFLHNYAIKLNEQVDKKIERDPQEPKSNKLEDVLAPIGNSELSGASNDLAADKDQLGFESYAKAFAELIGSRYTQPPLTIGIYGPWGVGKSTLLKYIQEYVKNYVHIVKFNAWEYSASKSIWPGLVRKIMDQMESELSLGGQFNINIIKYRRIVTQLVGNPLRLGIILSIFILFLVKNNFNTQDISTALLGVGFVALITSVVGIINIWFSPLSRWSKTLLKDVKYGKQMGYMEEIHEDLECLQKELDKDKNTRSITRKYLISSDVEPIVNQIYKDRILVIIDDLDRCEPNKAVEVLQAINLLLDFKSFIICLGIDARVITQAIETHYGNLLVNAEISGYEYLEKIVQIPFKIPEPSKGDIAYFIAQQLADPDQKENPQGTTLKDLEGLRLEDLKGLTLKEIEHLTHDEINDLMPKGAESLLAFEETEKQAFKNFTPFIRRNPRHIKRLINIYRLVRILAEQKRDKIVRKDPSMIIRWLLICGQWPYSTCMMLEIFDKIEEEQKNKNFEPIEGDVLVYLYKEINLEKNRKNINNKLDYDSDLLNGIINCEDGRLDANDLMTLRRYTVNINPAVEAVFELEVS